MKFPNARDEQSDKRQMPEPGEARVWISQSKIELIPKQSKRDWEFANLAPRTRVRAEIGDKRDQAERKNSEKNNQAPEIMADETNNRGRSDQGENDRQIVNQRLNGAE